METTQTKKSNSCGQECQMDPENSEWLAENLEG